jgi:Heterodisulfide reductase, subunit A and related polyferredoxins
MAEPQQFEPDNTVLVVGGGMAGIQTALDLAEAGRHVVIVDQSPAIGGLMTRLDRTFPTNNCDLCTLSPNLSEGNRKERIHLLEMTEVAEVSGAPGDFSVTLRTNPRHIDLDRCTACGDCLEKYPQAVRFTPGLDHRAPTCMRYPRATPQAFSIDLSQCEDVEGLVACCPAEAIRPAEKPREQTLRCGAVVLATGATVNEPVDDPFLGYGVWPDVVTGLEYEQILSATGPTQGRLERPSDGKRPQRIAWIQCVGSRGLRPDEVSYCSSACCMFSIKEAVVTKERFGDAIETTIFYMDIRTSGKDYELYYQRARWWCWPPASGSPTRCAPSRAGSGWT